MPRKKNEQSDSLEMLLDTMCNAFGGLILIAIMIALLAKPPTPKGGDPKAEIIKIKIKVNEPHLSDLTEELDVLAKMAQTIDPAVTNLVVQKNDLTVKVATAKNTMGNLATTPEEKKELEQKVSAQQTENDQKNKDFVEAQQQMVKVQASLNQASKGEPVTVRAPKARGTKKIPAFVIIKEGKIWVAERFVNGRKELNTNNFRREKEGLKTFFTPVPGKGINVLANGKVSSVLSNYLNSVPRDKYYLDVIVQKDSFAQFRVFKETFLKRDISYNWWPEEDEPKLVFSSSPTTGAGTQN